MNGEINQIFNRLVTVDNVTLAHPHLLNIRATLQNTGKLSWNRSPQADRISTCSLGIRLICNDHSFPPLEQISELPVELVSPAESTSMEWQLLLPQISSRFRLEIDVILRQPGNADNWFSDLGLAPATVEIQSSAGSTATTPYQALFSEVSVRTLSSQFLLLSGLIKNAGSAAWNPSSQKSSDFFLGLRSYGETLKSSPDWEGRGHLDQSSLLPGEETRFSAIISTEELKNSTYLKICMLREQHFWFDERGPSAYMLDLRQLRERHLSGKRLQIAHEASINARECLLCDGFLIQVSGTLSNTGTRTWNQEASGKSQLITMGIRLSSAESPQAIREGRASLPSHPIPPGTTLPFSITLSTLALPAGNYLVTLDLVCESQFWFAQHGSQSLEFGITVPERPHLSHAEPRPCSFNKLTVAQQKRILMIAPGLPAFDRQAGGKRMLHLLEILVQLGFEVSFFYESSGELENPADYEARLIQLGIQPRREILLHLSSLPTDYYDICILAWWECAERYLPVVRNVLPQARVIIDTVDIHWVREQRGVDAGELSLSESELAQRKLRELTVYQCADLLWVVTETDREAILKEDPVIPHHLVPLIYPDSPEAVRDLCADGILFVGGFRHPPNIAAARYGAEICAEFRAQSGRATPFYIVGDSPPDEILQLQQPGRTEVLGFVKDLENYYQQSRVALAPLQSGAGMKGKVCDAIYAGLPVITTAVGAEGLALEPKRDFFLASSSQEFVEALKQVFNPQTDLKQITKNARKKVSRLTAYSSVAHTIETSLIYRPVVIAVVTWNKKALLQECLESILALTDYPNYLIAVVSNGCTDGTAEMLADYQNRYPGKVVAWFNKENEFFVKPNNFIINHYASHDVVMINNDVSVLDRDWLTHLYQGAYSSPFIAAAGGMTIDADGRVSEAGAEIDLNGYGQNIGRGADPLTYELRIPRLVSFCSGCLLYLRRDALQQFGALNEEFAPMYYEDVEWQYRVKSQGYGTLYVPQCRAIHREGSSAGTDLRSGMKRFQEINRLKFLATGLLSR